MSFTIDDVRFLETQTDNHAIDNRRITQDAVGVGVNGLTSFQVSFASGLVCNVAGGVAYVRGISSVQQGMYECFQASGGTVTLGAADGTNPRIDQVVLIVQDATEDGGSNNRGFVTVIPGTPTSGADLNNRNGAPKLSSQSSPTIILLADCLVSAGNSPAFSGSNIRDRRPYAHHGTVPPLLSDVDMVTMIPVGMRATTKGIGGIGSNFNCASHQAAALMYLPKRIAATNMRWLYAQAGGSPGAISGAQAYGLAICDASGYLIASTGDVNFRGVAGDFNVENPALAFNTDWYPSSGYVFERGNYYIWAGYSAIGSGVEAYMYGAGIDNTLGIPVMPSVENTYVFKNSGATTFPAVSNILGYFDASTIGTTTYPAPIPIVALATS